MALELVTFEELADLLTLTLTPITEYPALGIIKDSMINAFEAYLGRALSNEERTDTQHIGKLGRSMIKLPGIPITAVDSVTVTQAGVSESYVETTHYEIMGFGLQLHMALKNCKVVIVYTGGLSAVSEEPGLNRAALYQTAYEFQGRAHIGAESVSTEGGSVSRPALSLLAETKRMLTKSVHPLKLRTA